MGHYKEEERIWFEAYSIWISEAEAVRIIQKLDRWTGMETTCKFRSSFGGVAYPWRKTIMLPSKTLTVGLLLHEYAHIAHYCPDVFTDIPRLTRRDRKGRKVKPHGVEFDTVLMRIHHYGKRKNYWRKRKVRVRKIK